MKDYRVWIAIILSAIASGYVVYRMAIDVEPTPCSPDGYPGRCYHATQTMCESVWARAEQTCKSAVKDLELAPGRLMGPIIFKCQLANLDEAYKYSRKSSYECDEMIKDLEKWKKSNDIR